MLLHLHPSKPSVDRTQSSRQRNFAIARKSLFCQCYLKSYLMHKIVWTLSVCFITNYVAMSWFEILHFFVINSHASHVYETRHSPTPWEKTIALLILSHGSSLCNVHVTLSAQKNKTNKTWQPRFFSGTVMCRSELLLASLQTNYLLTNSLVQYL